MKLPKLPKLSILFILVAFLGCSPSSDNEDTLAEKIKTEEHILYPKIIDRLSAGEIELP
jgi:hypothetical protein